MNSVDRATLIDFALGRLEDAEAAALARRAEVDSEFAQTLDALRQELTTLDRVRLDALRAAPRRAPLLAVESQVAQDSEFKEDSDDADVNGNADAPVSALSPALSPALSSVDQRAVDDALDAGNRDDALLPLSSSRVVKIRRVGPAYPFYADDQDASSTPTLAEEKSENSEAEQSAQVSETEPFATDAEKSQNSEAEQNAQSSETEPLAIDAEKSQNSEAGQNAQSSETEPLATDAPKSENSEAEQNAQFSETESLATDAEKSQNSEAEQSAQTSRRFKRFDFIPKFIAAASSSQGSPFVAKKARLLDAASPLVGFAEEISNANEFFETPNAVKLETPNIGADFDLSDATRNDEAQDEKVRDAEAAESPNDGKTSLSTPRSDEEERVCRVDNQRDGADFNVSDATRNDEAQDEKVRDAEAAESPNDGETSLPTPRSDEEERLYRVDYQDNVEDFNVSNLAARRLAELLGREPTAAEREEYYWEEVDDERAAVPAEARRPSLLTTSARWATAPVVAVGRATLAFCGSGRRAILGADAFAATKPRRRRQPGKASDTMISTVAGILIATFVVFPLMRLAVREIFTTIAKSAVRKIGENVAISENAPQSDLLPFISEQLVFPRYETADPQGVGVVETPLETGTRSETPLPPADDSPLPLDPTSTPPTLEPVPVGAILDVAPPTF